MVHPRRQLHCASTGIAVVAYFALAVTAAFLVFGATSTIMPSSTPSMPTTITSVSSQEEAAMILQRDMALSTLTIVSMNVAGCVPSMDAPDDWNPQVVAAAIRDEILKSNPDILALQEVPVSGDDDEGSVARLFPGFQSIGTSPSHAGYVQMLVRKELSVTRISMSSENDSLPAVVAQLEWNQHKILVASVHLAPFKDGSLKRRLEVEALLQRASSLTLPLIFAGDTNMRATEDDVMEGQLGLVDVWKLAGQNPKTKFTWDTQDYTSSTGGSFNRYYGDRTRQYTARYDRIYYYAAIVNQTLQNIQPQSFDLIADQPVTSPYHFLSDHFGISTVLKLKWNEL